MKTTKLFATLGLIGLASLPLMTQAGTTSTTDTVVTISGGGIAITGNAQLVHSANVQQTAQTVNSNIVTPTFPESLKGVGDALNTATIGVNNLAGWEDYTITAKATKPANDGIELPMTNLVLKIADEPTDVTNMPSDHTSALHPINATGVEVFDNVNGTGVPIATGHEAHGLHITGNVQSTMTIDDLTSLGTGAVGSFNGTITYTLTQGVNP